MSCSRTPACTPTRTTPPSRSTPNPHRPALPRDPGRPPLDPHPTLPRHHLNERHTIGTRKARTRPSLLPTSARSRSRCGAAPTTPRHPPSRTPRVHAARRPLTAGWRPWRTKLRYDVKGVPLDYDNPGCVTEENALFCGGTGITAARIDAASGRILWRTRHPPSGGAADRRPQRAGLCVRGSGRQDQARGGSRRRHRAPALATRHQQVPGRGPVRRRTADHVPRLLVVRDLRAVRKGTVAGVLAGRGLHSVRAGRRPLRPVLGRHRAARPRSI
ncbi:hypothetical protein SALBM311S_11656 [Streptomyces alboniger]